MRLQLKRLNDHGFTVTETAISVAVASILVIVVFAVTFNYYAFAVQGQEEATLALESQSLLGQMVEDLRLADGIGANNQLSDPHAPVGGWQTSDANNTIVVQSPVTDNNHNIVYHPDTGFPYQNEYVYFVSGTTLYKRVIQNADATGNTAISTCPDAASSSSCLPDRIFSTNVTDISFTFYDTNNAETADPLLARSVRLTVRLAKSVFGRNIELTNTMHVTQRNE